MWICASTISMRCSLPFGPPAGAADVPGAGACPCAAGAAGALQYFVGVNSRSTTHLDLVSCVRHEGAILKRFPRIGQHRQSTRNCQFGNEGSCLKEKPSLDGGFAHKAPLRESFLCKISTFCAGGVR